MSLIHVSFFLQIHVAATESYITGKNLHDVDALQAILSVLSDEIVPNLPPAAASIQYRKSLALNLFYKVSQCH